MGKLVAVCINATSTGEDTHDCAVRIELAVEVGGHLGFVEQLLRHRKAGINFFLGRSILGKKRDEFARVAKRA